MGATAFASAPGSSRGCGTGGCTFPSDGGGGNVAH
jgi:hypothetical protein